MGAVRQDIVEEQQRQRTDGGVRPRHQRQQLVHLAAVTPTSRQTRRAAASTSADPRLSAMLAYFTHPLTLDSVLATHKRIGLQTQRQPTEGSIPFAPRR